MSFCFLPGEWAVWRTVLEFQGHSRWIGVLCSTHFLIVEEIFCAQCCFTLEKASFECLFLYPKFILIKPRRSILILQLFGSYVGTMTSILPRVRDILNDWSWFPSHSHWKKHLLKGYFWIPNSFPSNQHDPQLFHCYLKAEIVYDVIIPLRKACLEGCSWISRNCLWIKAFKKNLQLCGTWIMTTSLMFFRDGTLWRAVCEYQGHYLIVVLIKSKLFSSLFETEILSRIPLPPKKALFWRTPEFQSRFHLNQLMNTCFQLLVLEILAMVSKFSEDGIFSWAVLEFQSHFHRNWLIQYLISVTWKGCSWTPRLSCA